MWGADNELSETAVDGIIDKMVGAKTKENFLDQVQDIFDIYGLGHGCLHSVDRPYSPVEALWRVLPGAVTEACSALVNKNKHPAVILGKNRHFPFDLFDYREHFKDDPESERLYVALENSGVNQAYGLPVQTSDRGTFVFVIGRPDGRLNTVELLTLQAICTNAINKIQQFEARPCDNLKGRKLTDQERRLLILQARGSSFAETSEEFELSEFAISSILSQTVQKLEAQNVSHAIVLALIEGEFALAECKAD